jgi:hypothetical protein
MNLGKIIQEHKSKCKTEREELRRKRANPWYRLGENIGLVLFLGVSGWVSNIIAIYSVNNNVNDLFKDSFFYIVMPIFFSLLVVGFVHAIYNDLKLIEEAKK